jgi:hypothetical protein
MRDHIDNTPAAGVDDLVGVARAQLLSSGISMEIDDRVVPLYSRITDAELEEEAREILEDIKVQSLLETLPVLGYNSDKGTRYIIVEDAADKALLAGRSSITPVEDMDLIVCVDAHDNGCKKTISPYPRCLFHLSKSPRFDYDTATLTGVSECYDLYGSKTYFEDIWVARAIMSRLPDEDMTHEDTRYYIDVALGKICSTSSEPEL